uniref:Uncharacterized protein n=1 Tax=Bartonella rochalimae ATCC BAA-1498 TaxID=685782 RepID=E6YN71_9HYPH|nr:hypothetical protein BARRO_120083 [Bartonella rochalimae ATCC BAA-1498]
MPWKKKAKIVTQRSDHEDFYSLHCTHQWSWEKIGSLSRGYECSYAEICSTISS